jgi:hypothetical protein
MIGETNDARAGRIFLNPEEAKVALEALLIDMSDFRKQLGGSALSAIAQETLMPLVEELNETAADITDAVFELESKEQFGGEESYWNVFRYFCVEGKRGQVNSVADIWDHLALTFDMSAETYDTLADTLLDWKVDIETDAKKKFKVTGRFEAAGYGYVFYEDLLASRASRQTTKRVASSPKLKAEPEVIEISQTEAEKVEDSTEQKIISLIEGFGGSAKQATVVKSAFMQGIDLDYVQMLRIINEMTAAGVIYKFKPLPKSPTHLALSEEYIETSPNPVDGKSSEERESTPVDTELAYEILKLLTARGRKPKQMMATSQMISKISLQDGEDERVITSRDLNTIARLLESKGLVKTDTGTPLQGGGKEKSRAKSREVFRVGIPDSASLDAVRAILQTRGLEDLLK